MGMPIKRAKKFQLYGCCNGA